MKFFSKLYKPWFITNPFLVIKSALFDVGFFTKGWVRARTCFNRLIWIDNTKSIGRAIYRNGVYELPTSEVIWRLLSKDSVFFDVGANVGYYSLLAAEKISDEGHIVAFEPRPDIFKWLKNNLSDCLLCKLHQAAVSDSEGFALLNIPVGSEENEGLATLVNTNDAVASHQVKTVALDNIPQEKIDVLKMDVEGYEATVLAGAHGILSKKIIQSIVFEEHDEKNSKVIPTLISYGYSIYSIGWNANGVILKPLGQPNIHLVNEAQNYIATLTPEKLLELMSPKGWHVLTCKAT